ncbi:hypothetical protein ATCV1_z333L [Acanthocystis turfacea chlorella virus 1]|uniref:Uncharacterized protein z333L n=1 Tax=Chlorovirus heliozoae TaxID=322019 RepID=A7K8U3_9PHYC|nr:hypothetical protein ATCV1_z333L [Acanthocystis turfacea chlorella virus 1]ABT16467.1 hypothetical protein ATCV1_z333L [Acanthocystis turfacea chlorella virus 1]
MPCEWVCYFVSVSCSGHRVFLCEDGREYRDKIYKPSTVVAWSTGQASLSRRLQRRRWDDPASRGGRFYTVQRYVQRVRYVCRPEPEDTPQSLDGALDAR